MKTLKLMLAGMALLFIGVAAKATAKPGNVKQTREDVINTYIDAIAHGNLANLDKALDDNMQFSLQRGENVSTLAKDDFIASLKNAGSSDQQVTTTTTIEQEDDNDAVIKISFKYADYTRIDEITLANTGSWVITKAQSTYK